jgi:site-specific DNA-cytosine methylase
METNRIENKDGEGINVLSLFDGMSCGQIALERAGIIVKNYYASEIDKPAINVARFNYPRMTSFGDVNELFFHKGTGFEVKNGDGWLDVPYDGEIDLLIGGSPCQDISNLSKFKLGLDGSKSSLFYQYWRMWQETKPKYFLLENVAGNKSAIASITKLMGARPIRISSNWVSAQNRLRLYWTNIPVNTLPKKRNILLSDILQENVDDKYYQNEGWLKWWERNSGFQLEKGYSSLNAYKAGCLTKRMYASWNGNFIQDKKGIRRLTPVECERLQTVPDNYTKFVDDKFRYEMLGNGWTVDIIAHILKHMKL